MFVIVIYLLDVSNITYTLVLFAGFSQWFWWIQMCHQERRRWNYQVAASRLRMWVDLVINCFITYISFAECIYYYL